MIDAGIQETRAAEEAEVNFLVDMSASRAVHDKVQVSKFPSFIAPNSYPEV